MENPDNTAPRLQIPQATIDAFGPTLAERVEAYMQAVQAHKHSIGIPRPSEHPLAEAIAAAGGMDAIEILAAPPGPDAPAPNAITKLRLVEILGAAGKLRDAFALLKLGAPISELTDAELLLRERWNAARTLDLTLPEVAFFLEALGIDPESLLA